MDRNDVARALEEISLLLDLSGENAFKVRAYAAGARAIETFDGDIAAAAADGSLRNIKGIGAALFEKVSTLVSTGRLPYLEELRKKFPPGLFELFRLPGLGPKKVRLLYEALRIDSLAKLRKACEENRLLGVAGLGAKTQENILKAIALVKAHTEYHRIDEAQTAAEAIVAQLRASGSVRRLEIAGSLRRRKEIVRDLDVLAVAGKPERLSRAFVSLPGVESVGARGKTKSSIRLSGGMAVDLRVVSAAEFPAALLYFTGSKEHNTALRARAKKMGMKLNEYGLYREGSSHALACKSETEIYRRLGLDFIPPELREDQGEIEASEKGELPELVTPEQIRGLFHVHTTASDGRDSLESMLAAVSHAGFEYVAITDHSRSAGYAHGLDEKRVLEQHRSIDAARRNFPKLKIYKGTEADILPDGSIDFGNDFLRNFDIVIASVHSRFGLSEEEQTRRVIRAVENPHVTILGHPTGRLLLEREAFAVNLTRVIDAAAASGCAIEINASPHRLDLDWRHCRRAVEKGVLLAIDPDAHSVEGINVWPYGVGIARKGWARKKDILNTRTSRQIDTWLNSRKA